MQLKLDLYTVFSALRKVCADVLEKIKFEK